MITSSNLKYKIQLPSGHTFRDIILYTVTAFPHFMKQTNY